LIAQTNSATYRDISYNTRSSNFTYKTFNSLEFGKYKVVLIK